MFKHLIFDLDGTIIDTLSSISYALKETMEHFKLNYDVSLDRTKSFLGYGTPYLLKNICNNDNLDYETLINYFISRQINAHILNARIFDELFDVLKILKDRGIKLYVATNKPDVVAQYVVPYLYGKDFFEYIIGQKENVKKKPDPECVNIIINKFNLNKDECIYLGDGEVDVITGHNANIKTCLTRYGYGKYKEFDNNISDYIIDTPKELKNIIK